jgi:hypothetical protein
MSFLITNGWASMDFGLPGAIAAKLARPDVPVWWIWSTIWIRFMTEECEWRPQEGSACRA